MLLTSVGFTDMLRSEPICDGDVSHWPLGGERCEIIDHLTGVRRAFPAASS